MSFVSVIVNGSPSYLGMVSAIDCSELYVDHVSPYVDEEI